MGRFSYHLPILGYHRVGPPRGDHVPTVTAETFERQLNFLVRNKFRVVNLDALVGMIDRGGRIPSRTIVITFDDGYEETFSIAWPLLKRRRFPATVFITPNEVGLEGFANWEQVGKMARDGVTIGCHTMNHRYLPLVSEAKLSEEIVDSKRVIEERISQPVLYFSYPVGGYTPLVQVTVRKAGYRAACTTNRAWSHKMDPFALRRVKITEKDRHPIRLWAKLSGFYDTFRQLEQPA